MSNRAKLAIFGGAKAVTRPPVENWRKVDQNVKDAVNRLMDQDICTIGNGSGVIEKVLVSNGVNPPHEH